MSWFSDAWDAVTWVADRAGDGIKAVSDAAGDVIKGAGDAIVKVVDYGADVVRAIAKDPIPTLLRYGAMAVGASFGIPPYVTSAAITAAQGGKLEDIALSAATSYATTSFMADTQIGADLKNYTVNEWSGDFTDSMTKTFNLPLDTAMQVAKVSNAALTSSLVGGINAAITGKSIAQGISSGFTSGLVYSGTNSYFDSVNKDPSWGFSPQALNLMKGVTSTALNTAISGKGDPAEAVGNYIAYASLNMAGSELWNKTKNTYNTFTEKTKDLKSSSDNVTALQTEYENKLKESEDLRVAINKDSADYQKIIEDKYTPFKTNYDNLITKYDKKVKDYNSIKESYEYNVDTYNNNTIISASSKASILASIRDAETVTLPKYAAEANALADQAAKLYVDNKPILDSLEAKSAAINDNVEEFNSIKYDIEAPTGGVRNEKNPYHNFFGSADNRNTAQKLKDASDKYQADYETWAAAQSEADKSAENYTKALAEVATRDATIDAVNSGAITATKQDDGDWVLSNGMTLTKDGEFIQEGVQQFTSAVGINQKPLDLTRMGGEQTAALGKDQITDTPLIPLEEAPPLPDNTVTEVLTDAGLVDGSKDEDLTIPAASDQDFQAAVDRSTTDDKPIEDVLTDAGLVDESKDDNTLGGLGLSVPKNTPLGDLSSPINEGTVTDLSPSDMGGGTGLLSTGDVALPSLPSMGGGSGLSVPTNTIIGDKDSPINDPDVLANVVPGTVTETGVTALDKSVPLGDPNSFINTGTLPKSVTPATPVKPTTPVKPAAPVTPTTPTAVAPAAVATEDASRTDNLVDEILGFDVSADFDPLWLLNDRTQAKTTKIASGGYLDDLLADPTSFNDLLRILRS